MIKIKTKVRIALILFLALFGIVPFTSGQPADCSQFHKGVFHVYLAKNGQHYIVYRDDQTEKEVVEGSTDTLIWHIDWKDDCDYTVQFVSNSTPLTAAQERFLRKHQLFYHLQTGGKDFCVYTETVDKAGGHLIEKDTMWLHEIAAPASASLAVEIRSESLLRNRRFSDTSSYAVIYIYRPKTVTFSAYSYDMYIEDHVLCEMKVNSSYIFAVYRPGPVTLRSLYARDTCSLPLTIEPGKSYYIRSKMDFGIFGGRDYNLKMELMPAAEGKKEFDRTFR